MFDVWVNIYNKNMEPLTGVTVQSVTSVSDLTPVLQPLLLADKNHFTVQSDYDRAIVFKLPGYKTVVLSLSTLDQFPDVIMEKSFPLWIIPVGLGAAFVLSDEKKIGVVTTEKVKTGLLITGGVLGVFIIKQLLDKFGLGKDPSAGDQTNLGSPWNPTYWQKFSSYTYAITQDQAIRYSKTIRDSFTVMQDNFNQVLSVFKLMKTKANVSYLSYVFNQTYQEDLLSFLGDGGGVLPWDGLSQTHMQTIIDLVNKLPNN